MPPRRNVPATVSEEPQERLCRYLRANWAESTLQRYQYFLDRYQAWCQERDIPPMPANNDTLIEFFEATIRPGRVRSLLCCIDAITFYHQRSNIEFDPTIARYYAQRVNIAFSKEAKKAKAIDIHLLRKIITAQPNSPRGIRDKALLLIGFAGALRAGELGGLDITSRASDGTGFVSIDQSGLKITIHKSKTDQAGRGIRKLITRGCAPCPIAALEEWLSISNIKDGCIFRSIRGHDRIQLKRITVMDVSRIIKRSIAAAYIAEGTPIKQSELIARTVSGHSLRAGFVTSAVMANIDADSITAHVGWTSSEMIVRYARMEQFKGVGEEILKNMMRPNPK